jgi:tetratricopeptide (TPR) repeat protein
MVSQRTDLALDKRDIKAAIGIVERYLKAQPSSEEGRARLIQMQIASGNVPRAIEVAKEGVEFRPQDPVSAERVGELYLNTGDAASAAKEFERAFTLDPKSIVYLEKSANARLLAGNPQEALALLRGASELVAGSPVLRAIGATALAKTGKRDEAIVAGRDALVAARALPEKTVENVERTAVVLREMFPPDRPGDFEAFVLQSGTPTAVESAIIADTWMRSGPTGGDKALEWCGKVEAGGESVQAGVRSATAMTRGSVLYSRGDLKGACDAFETAAGIAQRNAAALNNAAYLLVKVKNDTAKAFELASLAVQLAPAQADYLDTLGYVLFKSGKLADAEDVLNKSVAVAPTASALMHLAQVRAGQGNVGDARQLLDRARAKSPDADTAKEIEEITASLKGK